MRPDNITDEHLDYLDNLRDSGATNMFGARPFIQSTFALDKNEAGEIVKYWMDTFGNDDR